MHCGAEKVINDIPAGPNENVSHGICPRCEIRLEAPQLRKLQNLPEADKIQEPDKDDLRQNIRGLIRDKARWVAKDGRSIFADDPELQRLFDELQIEVRAEMGDGTIRK